MSEQHTFFRISPALQGICEEVTASLREVFSQIEETTEYNQQKVLAAFIDHRVSESHFTPTTGYGYGDRGRDTLDQVFAQVMGTEDALVRHSIVSGTHAITIALFGVLRPGDVLLAATGAPYDTLEQVIGMREASPGSLREYGIGYQEVSLAADGWPDIPAITRALRENAAVKAVHIQRSRGYSLRPSLPVSVIGDVIAAVRAVREDVVVFVDNCYGEFAERLEPSAVGADLMAGSLIKNPGGGIAENGGYICGRADLVEQCAYRMTTPRPGAGSGRLPRTQSHTVYGPVPGAPRSGGGHENRRLRLGTVPPSGLRRHSRTGGIPGGYHPGRAAKNPGSAGRFLPGHAAGGAGGCLCGAGALGYARLREPRHYGRGRLYYGGFH